MSCKPIRMKDGTAVLVNMKPGARLTERDRAAIAEWVQFCRERRYFKHGSRWMLVLQCDEGAAAAWWHFDSWEEGWKWLWHSDFPPTFPYHIGKWGSA